jgi:hypothetical protein
MAAHRVPTPATTGKLSGKALPRLGSTQARHGLWRHTPVHASSLVSIEIVLKVSEAPKPRNSCSFYLSKVPLEVLQYMNILVTSM